VTCRTPSVVPARAIAICVTALLLAGCTTGPPVRPRSPGSGGTHATGTGPAATPPRSAGPPSAALSIAAAPFDLARPVQREVAVGDGSTVYLAGGLDASGSSTSRIVSLDPRSGRSSAVGSMPHAFHDAAGAMIGGRLFVFGGGSSGGTDLVQAFDPRSGTGSVVGHLPVALSDLAAARVGGTVYLVGGYDGAAPRPEVYATTDGRRFTKVATLPQGVRYPAVTAVGTTLVIAGGLTASGVTDAVRVLDTRTGSVRRVGTLPVPIGEATSFSVGGLAYVAGGRDGRGAAVGSVVAIDPGSGAVTRVRSLPRPVADAASVSTPGGVVLLGGWRGSAVSDVVRATAPSTAPSPDPSSSAVRSSASPTRGRNVYRAIAHPGLAPAVAGIPTRVYVPNNHGNSVSVIDPATFRVVRTFAVGVEPQHVTPSWDLRHLYVGNTYSNTLTQIDPATGKPGRTIAVPDPYNLYFTPDGSLAIDVAERLGQLVFFNPRTWRQVGTVPIPWAGADHLDFSADGRYLLISTEFAGEVVKVNVARRKVVGDLHVGGSPVDVKLSPDGSVFFVANQIRNGVSVVDPATMREIGFIPTGAGAHGFCVSRDTKDLYVSNRLAGTISVIDFSSRKVVDTWRVGGSPDMLQVSADGRQLWTSNRYDATVSVISTATGKVLHTIAVGADPHGLTLFPQPGRYSIGHNGVYR
jgi:YVTN family beta-propeller protein